MASAVGPPWLITIKGGRSPSGPTRVGERAADRSARTPSARPRSGTRSAAGSRSRPRRRRRAEDDDRSTSIDRAVTSRSDDLVGGRRPAADEHHPVSLHVEPGRHRGVGDVQVDQLAGAAGRGSRGAARPSRSHRQAIRPSLEEPVRGHPEDPLRPPELGLGGMERLDLAVSLRGRGSTSRSGPRRSGGRRPGSTRAGRSTPRPRGRRPAGRPRGSRPPRGRRRRARTRPTASTAGPTRAS